LRVLRLKRQELETEIAHVEADLLAYMESTGQAEIATGEGCLCLVQEPGLPPVLVWTEPPRRDEEP
jgi:hypothetical protein